MCTCHEYIILIITYIYLYLPITIQRFQPPWQCSPVPYRFPLRVFGASPLRESLRESLRPAPRCRRNLITWKDRDISSIMAWLLAILLLISSLIPTRVPWPWRWHLLKAGIAWGRGLRPMVFWNLLKWLPKYTGMTWNNKVQAWRTVKNEGFSHLSGGVNYGKWWTIVIQSSKSWI